MPQLASRMPEMDTQRATHYDYHVYIGVAAHCVALHLHPCYQAAYHYARGDFPNAEWISDRTISLPLSAKLKDQDVEDVIVTANYIIGHSR